MAQTEQQVRQQYDEAIINARSAYQNAADQLQYALSQLDTAAQTPISGADIPGTPEAAQQKQQDDARKALQARVDTLQKTYNDAQQSYTTVLTQRAAATGKAADDADPATRARLQAQAEADTARAAQIKAESSEFITAAPERREAARQDARLAKAKADEAEYNLTLARETDPQKREAAQAAVDRAKAETARIQAETAQIGKPKQLTPGEAAVDTATATTAAPAADAALQQAQANAKTAQANYEDAVRRGRQAPTDQQAQQAIQAALQSSQLANQQLEAAIKQAGNLNPIAVQQAQATLASTQAATQKNVLGDLAGLRDRIGEIKALVRSGEISPAEGDLMVQAQTRGITVADAFKQQQADRSSARTQDVSNKNQLASTFGSTFNEGLGTIADLNKYAQVGSTAGADAFVALMNMAQDRLKSYELPAAQTTDYLGGMPQASTPVGAMVNAAQPVQPTVAQQPAAQGTNAPITINIGGGGQQQSGLLQPGQTGTAADPHAQPFMGGGTMSPSAGLTRVAAQSVPANDDDIYNAYGVAPNQRRTGGTQVG